MDTQLLIASVLEPDFDINLDGERLHREFISRRTVSITVTKRMIDMTFVVGRK